MNTYATFRQRFAAIWIDFFVFLPLMVINGLVEAHSKHAAIALVVPMTMLYQAYTIYLHGRFGQTIGKRVMGIRVVRTKGGSIGWREAWLRSSVDILFSVLGVIGSIMALASIADADYYGVGWTQRAENLAGLEPSWLAWSGVATQVWVWSEVVVMLFNKRRRAVHDFIAGTVVVSDQKTPDAASQTV